jgi:hypothetical protein
MGDEGWGRVINRTPNSHQVVQQPLTPNSQLPTPY